MNWKEFLKPTIAKIILLIIFMIISVLFLGTTRMDAPSNWGWPFPVYVSGCNFFGGGCVNEFVWFDLILDIIFWYVISCIIVIAYHVNKKKKK
jgi:hypothetical protein